MKVLARETKLTSLEARTRPTFLETLISKHDFRPVKLPGLSRNGPQYRKYDLYKMKQFHWLLCVVKNFDWSRKIAPQSNLTRASLLEHELTAKAELRNLQILKKMLEKSSQFLSSKQPCEPKSLGIALKITVVEKIPSEKLWLRST